MPCDKVVTVTEYVTLSDSPKLEVVYKLAELRDENKVKYTAKLSAGKISYPGRKQVFRKMENGKMIKDYIGLENENLGEPLLKPVVKSGKIVEKMSEIEEIKKYAMGQLNKLTDKLKEIDSQHSYSVEPSEKLVGLLEEVRKLHCDKEN